MHKRYIFGLVVCSTFSFFVGAYLFGNSSAVVSSVGISSAGTSSVAKSTELEKTIPQQTLVDINEQSITSINYPRDEISEHNNQRPSTEEEKASQDVSTLLAENKRLQDELAALQSKYQKEKQADVTRLAKLSRDLIEANTLLEQNGLRVRKVELADLKKHIPSPFAEQLVFSPNMGVQALDFYEEEQNYDWAITTEQRISDFFITHRLGHTVNLSSVVCKTKACEIRGFEIEEQNFSILMEDIKKEPWWELHSSSSFSGYPSEQGKIFYAIMKKI